MQARELYCVHYAALRALRALALALALALGFWRVSLGIGAESGTNIV